MYHLYILGVVFASLGSNFWKASILTNEKKCAIMGTTDGGCPEILHRQKTKERKVWARIVRPKLHMTDNKKHSKYSPEMPRKMYLFFLNYSDAGLPSFRKFAGSVGLTLEELTKMRSHKKFDAAFRECKEIRRDYLIDRALEKRMDGSFAKFLISIEDEREAAEDRGDLLLRLEVKE